MTSWKPTSLSCISRPGILRLAPLPAAPTKLPMTLISGFKALDAAGPAPPRVTGFGRVVAWRAGGRQSDPARPVHLPAFYRLPQRRGQVAALGAGRPRSGQGGFSEDKSE